MVRMKLFWTRICILHVAIFPFTLLLWWYFPTGKFRTWFHLKCIKYSKGTVFHIYMMFKKTCNCICTDLKMNADLMLILIDSRMFKSLDFDRTYKHPILSELLSLNILSGCFPGAAHSFWENQEYTNTSLMYHLSPNSYSVSPRNVPG